MPAGTEPERPLSGPLHDTGDDPSARVDALEARNAALERELADIYRSRTWLLGRKAVRFGRPLVAAARQLRTARRAPRAAVARRLVPGSPWWFAEGEATGGLPPRQEALERVLDIVGDRAGPFPPSVAEELWSELQSLDRHRAEVVLSGDPSPPARRALLELELALAAPSPDGARTRRTPRGHHGRPVVVVDGRGLQVAVACARAEVADLLAVVAALGEIDPRPEIVSLFDPAAPPPLAGLTMLTDRLAFSARQAAPERADLFLSLSPLTTSVGPAVPFLREGGPPCAAVMIGLDDRRAAPRRAVEQRVVQAARRHALAAYDLGLVPSAGLVADVAHLLRWPSDRLVTTGTGAPAADADRGVNAIATSPYVLVPTDGDAADDTLTALGAFAAATRWPGSPARGLRIVVAGCLPADRAEAVRALAAELGLDERLDLLEPVDPKAWGQWLAGARAALVVARADEVPVHLLHAVHAGCPAVVSDLPSHREIVGPGPWCAPAGDVDELGRALSGTLRNAEAYAASQAESARERSSPSAVTARVAAALQGLLDGGRPAALATPDRPSRPSLSVLVGDRSPGHEDRAVAELVTALGRHADVTLHSPADGAGAPTAPMDARSILGAGTDALLAVADDDPAGAPALDYVTELGGAVYLRHPPRVDGLHGSTALRLGELAHVAEPLLVDDRSLAARVHAESGREPLLVPTPVPARAAAVRVDQASRQRSAASAGYEPGRLHLVTVLVQSDAEDDPLAIPVLAWLERWGLDPMLHVLGPADPEAVTALASSAASSAAPGLGERLRFHGGLSAEEMTQHLLAADAAVLVDGSSTRRARDALVACAAHGTPTVTLQELAGTIDAPSYIVGLPGCISALIAAEAVEAVSRRRRERLDEDEHERAAYVLAHGAEATATAMLDALGLKALW